MKWNQLHSLDGECQKPCDARHEKHDKKNLLKGLCHCYTKRRMGTHGRAHPSFGMLPTFRKYDL